MDRTAVVQTWLWGAHTRTVCYSKYGKFPVDGASSESVMSQLAKLVQDATKCQVIGISNSMATESEHASTQKDSMCAQVDRQKSQKALN